jgi:site-specific DNA-cytosine methylase
VGISDSQIYKMAGNSLTVNVVREIGKSLKKVYSELNLTNCG